MRHFLRTLYFSIIVLAGTGCQKNVDEFVPDNIQTSPDTEWKAVITAGMPVVSLKTELRLAKATDSFSYNNTGIVFNSGSLSLTIPSNGLTTAAGTVPAGTIVRQSLLIQKKGDLISMSMPTVSNDRLLVSGGVFFTGLRQNNNDLLVSPANSLTIKYNNAVTLGGMKVYNGQEDLVNGFNWQLNTDVTYNKVNVVPSGYEVLVNKLQWVQSAYIFDTTGIPQTGFSIKLPEIYTNANTVAYISFNDMQTVAGTIGNIVDKKFVSGHLPVNRPVTLVVISKQANDYYFAAQQTVTALPSSGAGIQEVAMTPVKTSLAGVRAQLSNL